MGLSGFGLRFEGVGSRVCILCNFEPGSSLHFAVGQRLGRSTALAYCDEKRWKVSIASGRSHFSGPVFQIKGKRVKLTVGHYDTPLYNPLYRPLWIWGH